MQINVRCVGMERLIELLKRKEEHVADMRSFWRSAGLYLVKRSVRDSFGKEKSPDGTKWASWTKKYKDRMEKLGKGGNKILSNKGELRRSIGYVAFRDRVIVGSNLAYARRHQLGDESWKQNGKGIPPRPYIGVTDEDRMELLRMMRDYLRRDRRLRRVQRGL